MKRKRTLVAGTEYSGDCERIILQLFDCALPCRQNIFYCSNFISRKRAKFVSVWFVDFDNKELCHERYGRYECFFDEAEEHIQLTFLEGSFAQELLIVPYENTSWFGTLVFAKCGDCAYRFAGVFVEEDAVYQKKVTEAVNLLYKKVANEFSFPYWSK